MIELNYDCMKDILIYLSDNLGYEYDKRTPRLMTISWHKLYTNEDLLKIYRDDEILYNLKKLYEANLISAIYVENPNSRTIERFDVVDITLNGYNFLNNASNQTIWNKAKNRVAQLGNVALPIFVNLLMEEGANLISSKLL